MIETGLTCFKMTGSGNDFVFLDGRITPVAGWSPDRIRDICRRGTGVGADGVVILEPGSATGRVRYHFFNNDGVRAPMCGNGALCATRMAHILGLTPSAELVLETDSGDCPARCVPGTRDRATIELPDVYVTAISPIPLANNENEIHFIRVGVPHLVVWVDDVSAVRPLTRGRELRRHPAVAPDGANVNFVSRDPDVWRMRTFERGVEDETLACGTGAVASAAVLAGLGQIDLPWTVITSSGACLTVDGDSSGTPVGLRSPSLTGEGRLVFRAELEP